MRNEKHDLQEPTFSLGRIEERPDLFNFQNPNSFLDRLNRFGIKTENARQEQEDVIVEAVLEPGDYFVATGFSKIDPDDERYYYSNNPEQKKSTPLQLDTQSKEYKNLSFLVKERLWQSYRSPETDNQLLNIMAGLSEVIEQNIVSTSEDEDINKVSDIIKNRKSVCEGKALVAGLLLKTTLGRQLDIRTINGATSQFGQERPHDIGHMWLRVNNGKNVALYDPLYNHLSVYDLQNVQVSDQDPFSKYEVGAYFLGNIQNAAPLNSYNAGDFKLVKTVHGGQEFWVNSDKAHLSQIVGEVGGTFNTGGGKLSLVNGGFESVKDRSISNSARVLYPIKNFQKI